ncbi:uncharacterized protein LOC143300841 isoform X2 [Babylonia areolata]
MNYFPAAIAPAGYAVAAADKPGLYAASPYAAIPSPYATAQPGLPPGMQHYATQQYAMVSQPSPYSHAAAAYYATPSAAGYAATAGVPLSSLQTIPSSTPQSAYLSAQYPAAVGVQRAMLGPTPVTAAGYGGSPLYAASTYTGLPGVPGQPSRPAFGVAPVGYATATNLPPSSPGYPGATSFGPPY